MNSFTQLQRISLNWKIVPLFFLFTACFVQSLFALALNAPAPNFTLADLDGKKISLSDYQGKTVILKLGTTWCPGCRDQDQELQKLDDFISNAGIVLVEVFLDDPAEEVRLYRREYAMKSPLVTLLGNERLMRDYSVYAIPRLIILSPGQKVLSDSTGMTAAKIKARILQN